MALFEKIKINDHVDHISKQMMNKREERIQLLKNWNNVEHLNFFEIDSQKKEIEEKIDKIQKIVEKEIKPKIKFKKSGTFKNYYISAKSILNHQIIPKSKSSVKLPQIPNRGHRASLNPSLIGDTNLSKLDYKVIYERSPVKFGTSKTLNYQNLGNFSKKIGFSRENLLPKDFLHSPAMYSKSVTKNQILNLNSKKVKVIGNSMNPAKNQVSDLTFRN